MSEYITRHVGSVTILELPEAGPIPVSLITQGTYRSLFTFDEKIALYSAATTSVPLQILLADLMGSPMVDLNDPRVAFGLGYMVQLSIITYDRLLEILAYRE